MPVVWWSGNSIHRCNSHWNSFSKFFSSQKLEHCLAKHKIIGHSSEICSQHRGCTNTVYKVLPISGPPGLIHAALENRCDHAYFRSPFGLNSDYSPISETTLAKWAALLGWMSLPQTNQPEAPRWYQLTPVGSCHTLPCLLPQDNECLHHHLDSQSAYSRDLMFTQRCKFLFSLKLIVESKSSYIQVKFVGRNEGRNGNPTWHMSRPWWIMQTYSPFFPHCPWLLVYFFKRSLQIMAGWAVWAWRL